MDRKTIDIDKLSPMMREYIKTKEEYEDIILFYRLGDFYEMFFDDAIKVSHELELTLTGKNAGLKERVPMCGVPHHALDVYLEKLIDKGYKVAICEQVEDPKEAKGIVKREVMQVVSKGTLINTNTLDEHDNNYIASISEYKLVYAISYTEILSGKIYTTFVKKDDEVLISYLINLNIKEIVVNKEFNNNIINILKNKYNIFISYLNDIKDIKNKKIFKDIEDSKLIDNTKLLISYLENSQKKSLEHIRKVEYVNNNYYLYMNEYTLRNLELINTIRSNDKKNSLLWLLDKTKTAMGSRLLKNFIIRPIIDKKEIEKRHDLIELFNKEFLLKSELKEFLYEIYDLERLTGKVSVGNVNARDLLQLKNSLKVIPDINNVLSTLKLKKLTEYNEIYNLLEKSIEENPPITIKEGNVIKDGYNKELDELKSIKSGGKEFLSKFESEEKKRTGIKNLKIGYNKVFGYYIEISKGQVKEIKEEYGYERKQTISNCERFITPLLKEKENLILNAEDKINKLEYTLFNEIKDEIKKFIYKLQETAEEVAYYDVILSLSTVAEENNFVRANVNDKNEINIIDGRHPVVEKILEKEYISNDLLMTEEDNILIITGPNMSGKSTYMRQLAIIIVLNQIGSFVPAKEASLPIFDKIFTRIGASDDLVAGESTFMVEMKESADALKNATNNSLILFDELGRGTSTYDGMCLAASIIKYLNKHINCKTLFSTHYHELTNLEKEEKGIKNVHVTALEEENNIKFLHKVKPGSVDKSYGIGVASLANLPEEVIEQANKLLRKYEEKDKTNTKKEQIQLDFNYEQKDPLREYIESINPNEITPIESLIILNEIKKRSNE